MRTDQASSQAPSPFVSLCGIRPRVCPASHLHPVCGACRSVCCGHSQPHTPVSHLHAAPLPALSRCTRRAAKPAAKARRSRRIAAHAKLDELMQGQPPLPPAPRCWTTLGTVLLRADGVNGVMFGGRRLLWLTDASTISHQPLLVRYVIMRLPCHQASCKQVVGFVDFLSGPTLHLLKMYEV